MARRGLGKLKERPYTQHRGDNRPPDRSRPRIPNGDAATKLKLARLGDCWSVNHARARRTAGLGLIGAGVASSTACSMTFKAKAVIRRAFGKGRLQHPDGTYERVAIRGNELLAAYNTINPGIPREWLVSNLLHDLMHLCDQDPSLGAFDAQHGSAVAYYDEFVEERRQ